MARNLVKENKEEVAEPVQEVKKTSDTKAPDEKVEIRVITQEQLVINILEQQTIMLKSLYDIVQEGFKQVGVNFKDKD